MHMQVYKITTAQLYCYNIITSVHFSKMLLSYLWPILSTTLYIQLLLSSANYCLHRSRSRFRPQFNFPKVGSQECKFIQVLCDSRVCSLVHIAPAEENALSDSTLVDGTDVWNAQKLSTSPVYFKQRHFFLFLIIATAAERYCIVDNGWIVCKWHEAADRFLQLPSSVWACLFQTWQRCWR